MHTLVDGSMFNGSVREEELLHMLSQRPCWINFVLFCLPTARFIRLIRYKDTADAVFLLLENTPPASL